MTNRTITQHDLENAQRLKAHWQAKKSQLGLTQKAAAQILGYSTQATISQHLNGQLVLTAEAVLKWAQLLQVSPTDIDPRLGALGISNTVVNKIKVPILAAMSGRKVGLYESMEIMTRINRKMYGVDVDTEGFEPFAKKGSTLIVSQEEEPIADDEVFIRYMTPDLKNSINIIRRYVGRMDAKGVVLVKGLTSNEVEQLDIERIEIMDPIVSIERPIVNRPIRLRSKGAQTG